MEIRIKVNELKRLGNGMEGVETVSFIESSVVRSRVVQKANNEVEGV